MKIKIQLFVNGRYAYKGIADTDKPEQIEEMFRGALFNIDPTRKYRLDLTKELPLGRQDSGDTP